MGKNDDCDSKGIMSNVAVVWREAEEITGSRGFNEFTGMISVLKKLPWELGYPNPVEDRTLTDDDELAILEWIQGTAGVHAPRNAVFDAIQRIASEYKFNPPLEYLNGVLGAWEQNKNRQPRLTSTSVHYFR